MRALIIDDSSSMRSILRQYMREMKYDVVEAGNGKEALQKCEETKDFTIALVDWNMPVMNGLEAAAKLKDISPNVPIVMLTAFKDHYLEEKAYKTGVTWVLSKTENATKVLEFARILLRPDSPSAP